MAPQIKNRRPPLNIVAKVYRFCVLSRTIVTAAAHQWRYNFEKTKKINNNPNCYEKKI